MKREKVTNFKETSFDKLQSHLRQSLDNRFSDDLIKEIVLAFFENETLRLLASEYKVQAISPMNKEYAETIDGLNSHMVLLSRWIKSTPTEFNKKVGQLLTDYEEALDSIITYITPFYLFYGVHEDKHGNPIKVEAIYNIHDPKREVHIQVTSNSGPTEYFREPWPSKHIFYYSAMLVLLKSFSKKNIQKTNKRGTIDVLGLNIADYATILYYATIARYYSTDNIEAERARFIKKHKISTEPVNFKSAMSDIQNLKRRQVPGRMKSIKAVLEEYYPDAVERMEKELTIL